MRPRNMVLRRARSIVLRQKGMLYTPGPAVNIEPLRGVRQFGPLLTARGRRWAMAISCSLSAIMVGVTIALVRGFA